MRSALTRVVGCPLQSRPHLPLPPSPQGKRLRYVLAGQVTLVWLAANYSMSSQPILGPVAKLSNPIVLSDPWRCDDAHDELGGAATTSGGAAADDGRPSWRPYNSSAAACAAVSSQEALLTDTYSVVMLGLNVLFHVVIACFWRSPASQRLPGGVQLLSRACVGVVWVLSPAFLLAVRGGAPSPVRAAPFPITSSTPPLSPQVLYRHEDERSPLLRSLISSSLFYTLVCGAWALAFALVSFEIVRERLRIPQALLPEWMQQPNPSGGKFDVFLSHDWGDEASKFANHKRVKRLHRLLRAQGLTSWLDDEQMAGGETSARTRLPPAPLPTSLLTSLPFPHRRRHRPQDDQRHRRVARVRVLHHGQLHEQGRRQRQEGRHRLVQARV